MKNAVNIEGINFTPKMIETIKEWQEKQLDESYIEEIIRELDSVSMSLINNWDNFYDESHMKNNLTVLTRIRTELRAFVPAQKGGNDDEQ